MKELKRVEELYNVKVLCIFRAGSLAYNLKGMKSDKDLMVIVDDNEPLRHLVVTNNLTLSKTEYYILGRSYFKKVQEFCEDTNDFVVVYADNILGLKSDDDLLFIDESYSEEFWEIVNEDWLKKLPKFLNRFVRFFRLTIAKDAPNYKKHYHIYRIRSMLDNLDKSGKFNLDYAEPFKTIMEVYKEHYEVMPSKQEEMIEHLDYIENYAVSLELEK